MTGNTIATSTIDQLVEAVHPWVEHDVTRDQIKSVIWGIYRGPFAGRADRLPQRGSGGRAPVHGRSGPVGSGSSG